MIVFRRRPPDKYCQVKDELLRQDPGHVNWSDMTEQKAVKRKSKGLTGVLVQPLSIITNHNFDLKRSRNKPLSGTHDSDGDTATAGSSQVSTGGYHSLLGTSHKFTVHEEETKINRQTPHHSSRQRNSYVHSVDMTGIMMPRNCRDISHHVFRSSQSLPHLPHKPKAHCHGTPARRKDTFASFVNSRTKRSQWRKSGTENVGDSPCFSTSEVEPNKPKAHHHPKDSFASFKNNRTKCSREASDIGMDKDHRDNFDPIVQEPREQSPQWCQKDENNPEEDTVIASHVEVGDLSPLSIPGVTKRRLRMEEYNNEVGDLPPLAIPMWAKHGVKLNSRTMTPASNRALLSTAPAEENFGSDIKCAHDDEQYPFDEIAAIASSCSFSIKNGLIEEQEKGEDHPIYCYYDVDAGTVTPALNSPPRSTVQTAENFGSDIKYNDDEKYPFDEFAVSTKNSLEKQETGEGRPFDCYYDVDAPLSTVQTAKNFGSDIKCNDDEEYPFDEFAKIAPSSIFSSRNGPKQQETGEGRPFDCYYDAHGGNVDPTLTSAPPSTAEKNVRSDIKCTDDEEHPFDEFAGITPNSIFSSKNRLEQQEKVEGHQLDCYDDVDPVMQLAAHPQGCGTCSCFPFGQITTLPSDFAKDNNIMFISMRDANDSYHKTTGQDSEFLTLEEARAETNDDDDNPNEHHVKEGYQLDEDEDSSITEMGSRNKMKDVFIAISDASDSDQETIGHDPECPMFPKEKAQVETSDDAVGNDDLQEGHVINQWYPSDEDEDISMMAKKVPRNGSIFNSAMKFMDAFTANLDGYQYEIHYPHPYML